MPDLQPLRLFFAFPIAADAHVPIQAAANALQLEPPSVRVPSANYHVTLAFVGEVSAEDLPAVRSVGRTHAMSPFTLRFDAYEYWPKPEVVVVAARTVPASLEASWHALHGALAPHQWATKPKKLRPHVTLARNVAQAPVLPPMAAFNCAVTKFSLMRSDTASEHPISTVVDTWQVLYDSENTQKTR